MKHLQVETLAYRKYLAGYGEWLKALGYSKHTISSYPTMLKEFLHYVEGLGITEISELKKQHCESYVGHLKTRKNARREGGISACHINRHIDNLGKVKTYLKQSHNTTIEIKLTRLSQEEIYERMVLSIAEIEALYNACDMGPIGQRDRAMLTVYYGCGLRKSEGINLDVNDVLFERRLLYIRKTKNNYERYVPLTEKGLKDLEVYLYQGRPLLEDENCRSEAFFISERGERVASETFIKRLQVLRDKTGLPSLENKAFRLHALRHSIATHLLSAGMDLENIALFLGHRSLDSTQIYTHITNKP